jgi:hypothetical protein
MWVLNENAGKERHYPSEKQTMTRREISPYASSVSQSRRPAHRTRLTTLRVRLIGKHCATRKDLGSEYLVRDHGGAKVRVADDAIGGAGSVSQNAVMEGWLQSFSFQARSRIASRLPRRMVARIDDGGDYLKSRSCGSIFWRSPTRRKKPFSGRAYLRATALS